MPVLRIYDKSKIIHEIEAEYGSNLRKVLMDAGLSPYGSVSGRANCGGRGICATCGVWIEAGEPDPTHWHDKAANLFGYPRLSCQIRVEADMVIHLVEDKIMWGPRRQDKAKLFRQKPD